MDSSQPHFSISDPSNLSVPQVRAGRALLGWTRADAAKECGVGLKTFERLENESRYPTDRVINKIAAAFNRHGVQFVELEVGKGAILVSRLPEVFS
jgi:transcriptional regulator with XRE-family HTH domain